MKATKKWFLTSFFLASLLVFIFFIYILNIDVSENKNYIIVLTFILIGIKSLKEIIFDKYDYSINKIFWYFIFLFFFIAPLFQYLTSYVPSTYYIEERLYLKANLLILLWIYIYSFFSRITINNQKLKDNIKNNKTESINLNIKNINYLLIINIVILIMMSIRIGIPNLFIRGNNNLKIGTGFINDILNNGLRIIPAFSLAYTYYYTKETGRNKIYIIFYLIITILLNFPTSITRYWVGVVYLGIITVMFSNVMKNRNFDILIIIALFIVFPMFQMFKWFNFSDFINGNIQFKNFLTIFNNMDFDAYTMFQRIIHYTELEGYTHGNQIMSSLFFFIPRMIWLNKPYPTGEFVATAQNSSFTNLSSPLISEMFIDFGILGIVISGLVLGNVVRRLDYYYFKDRFIEGKKYIDYVYPFLLGFTIFIMRGALQPVVVFMFTFYLPLILKKVLDKCKIK